MEEEEVELDASIVINKLAVKIARLEVELVKEQTMKEYHMENYKILAQEGNQE